MKTAAEVDDQARPTAPEAAPIPTRFIAEGELAPLVKLLRCLGIDCAYDGSASVPAAINRAAAEHRTLLTLKPVAATERVKTFRLPPSPPESQLAAVSEAFALHTTASPFTRCLKCNELLCEELNPPPDSVPERVLSKITNYHRCPRCRRIYWHGTHVDRMRRRLAQAGMTLPINH